MHILKQQFTIKSTTFVEFYGFLAQCNNYNGQKILTKINFTKSFTVFSLAYMYLTFCKVLVHIKVIIAFIFFTWGYKVFLYVICIVRNRRCISKLYCKIKTFNIISEAFFSWNIWAIPQLTSLYSCYLTCDHNRLKNIYI